MSASVPAELTQLTNPEAEAPDYKAKLIKAIDEVKAEELIAKGRGLERPDDKSIKKIVFDVLQKRLEIYEKFKGKITDKDSLAVLEKFLKSPIKIHTDLYIEYNDKKYRSQDIPQNNAVILEYNKAIKNIKEEISKPESKPEGEEIRSGPH